MAYKRKTKDVVCTRCEEESRVPVETALYKLCCARRNKVGPRKGFRCLGRLRLAK